MSNFIAARLAEEYSKPQVDRLVDWIGQDADRVEELMAVFLYSEYRLTQRSAWIVGDLGKKHPSLMAPYISKMISRASEPNVHDAVKRNVLRVFEAMALPADHLDEIADFAFSMFDNPKEAIAIRVFAMTVLTRVCEQMPELWPELALLIEQYSTPESSPAWRVRARDAMARARKMGWE